MWEVVVISPWDPVRPRPGTKNRTDQSSLGMESCSRKRIFCAVTLPVPVVSQGSGYAQRIASGTWCWEGRYPPGRRSVCTRYDHGNEAVYHLTISLPSCMNIPSKFDWHEPWSPCLQLGALVVELSKQTYVVFGYGDCIVTTRIHDQESGFTALILSLKSHFFDSHLDQAQGTSSRHFRKPARDRVTLWSCASPHQERNKGIPTVNRHDYCDGGAIYEDP
jgi:hypothetical protein